MSNCRFHSRVCVYKFNVYFYYCIIASLYINFIFFYYQIENINSHATSIRIFFFSSIFTFLNSIIFSLPYFFLKRKYLIFSYLLLLDMLLISNVVYFKFYNNIIPVYSYSLIGNLKGSYYSLIKSLDIFACFYFLNTISLYISYQLIFKKKIQIISLKKRMVAFIVCVVFLIVTFFMGAFLSLLEGKPILQRFSGKFNTPFQVAHYGILPIWIEQIINYSFIENSPLTDSELERIDLFLSKNSPWMTDENVCNKNLIIILVESLDTWVTKFNKGQATPFLTELRQSENVTFVPNVLPQVNAGRSSDAQLLLNTGLTPVFENVVANYFITQYYPSLSEALHKSQYHSLTIIGNESSFWNQKTMNIAYHIDELIAKDNLLADTIIGMGISDKSVFKQTIPILKRIGKKPFYVQLITLSSHNGSDFSHTNSQILFPKDIPNEIKDYIKAIEYTDNVIKTFVNSLKKENLFENSVIVITGDHDSGETGEIRNYAPELLSSLEKRVKFIPLFIINSNKKYIQGENQVMGQLDIYSTILDVMGVNQYFWKGLGESIFSGKPPTFAVDKSLNIIGDTTNYSEKEIQHKVDSWYISDIIIRKKYFEKIK
ncbi:Lipoteichoic acid synthase 2 [termite gut metagenome]|uniref:Lipoteichoic acid synthase 2 n=1 Tax=termite gut metagenome TaxID=433724 RepID=A0A5J4QZQ2_9ZZZZ